MFGVFFIIRIPNWVYITNVFFTIKVKYFQTSKRIIFWVMFRDSVNQFRLNFRSTSNLKRSFVEIIHYEAVTMGIVHCLKRYIKKPFRGKRLLINIFLTKSYDYFYIFQKILLTIIWHFVHWSWNTHNVFNSAFVFGF